MDTAPEEITPEPEQTPLEERHVASEPPQEVPATPEQPENRFRRFFRLVLILLAGALIVFLLGVAAAYMWLYQPALRNLQEAQSQRDQVQQKVTSLEGQVTNLNSQGQENQSLKQELDSSQMHVMLLSCLYDVASARLALAENNPAQARVALSKTSDKLKSLQSMLSSDQQKVVTDMQSRLRLALGELDSNSYAAKSDLSVLTESLLQMEHSYFTNQ